MPWAKAAAVPALSGSPAPTDDGPVQPVPPDVQEDRDQGDAMTEEERETRVARDGARVQRMHELMRHHTKAELLRMAYAGGLMNHNSPEKWRKDEIASAVVDIESRAAKRSTLPAAATACPVPAKPLPQRVHHDECEKELYEGGTCTCDLIERYGPPSDRDDY